MKRNIRNYIKGTLSTIYYFKIFYAIHSKLLQNFMCQITGYLWWLIGMMNWLNWEVSKKEKNQQLTCMCESVRWLLQEWLSKARPPATILDHQQHHPTGEKPRKLEWRLAFTLSSKYHDVSIFISLRPCTVDGNFWNHQ